MNVINIANEIKEMMDKEKKEGESYNDMINRLIEETDLPEYTCSKGRTGVYLTEENTEKLKSLKAYSTEPYSSIILRLLLEK